MWRTLANLSVCAMIVECATLVPNAAAVGRCLPRADMIETLAERFNEHVVGVGVMAGRRHVLELFVSESGTWTVVVTRAGGISCIQSSGGEWTDVAPALEEDET